MAAKPRTIDDYLATVDREKRTALEQLRRAIAAAVPDAEECIRHNVPTFCLDGKMLISFGAAARHCALYAGSRSIAAHQDELAPYDTSKGTIRFQADRPLPAALVRKLVETGVARRRG
jgi:uncharacterized protein YdhG (YjbR/CyaY superfamily)